jgi:ribosomal protein S27AE
MKSLPVHKKYKTAIEFRKEMIAPCGMNCGSCLGFMRNKNHCPGCRTYDPSKPGYCRQCIIIRCTHLSGTDSKFCYECPKYPCPRLKALDKRYRTKYNTGLLNNLAMIKEKGIESFLAFETERRTCPQCGSIICVHRPDCFECGFSRPAPNNILQSAPP